MVSMFKPLFHGNVRLFGLAELPAAKDWIASTKKRLHDGNSDHHCACDSSL